VAIRAHAVGLSAIALTDHDTTDGVADAARQGARMGVRVIPGCEFSVRAPWGELHLLAFFLPPSDERLQAFLRDKRAARRRRGEQIVAKLQQLGVPIDLEDVQARMGGGDGGGALGRPHVARALVDCGTCDDVGDAFRQYLGRGKPAYVEKPLPTLGEVTTLVHAVGGLTVAAHLGDHGTEGQIRQFQDQGLDGIEVRHPSHAPVVEQRLIRIAERLGLCISGGSDWHGDSEYGETHAPLGGMRVPDTWLEQLEKRRESSPTTRTKA
jgi:predicted metal-dependent phosphoesterase TrpH